MGRFLKKIIKFEKLILPNSFSNCLPMSKFLSLALSIALIICGAISRAQSVSIINTVAGNGITGYTGDGGPAVNAEIAGAAVALDASGNLYIADAGNNCIRKVNAAGIISTIAGTGTPGSSGDGGPATAAELNNPISIAVDGPGNIYVGDMNNFKIRKINSLGLISTIAGTGLPLAPGTDGGDNIPAVNSNLNGLLGIAADNSGNVYFTELSYVRKINSIGFISTIAGTGNAYSGDGGPATAAGLGMGNYGIVWDGAGNVYFVDGRATVRKISPATPSGTITKIAGLAPGAIGYTAGPALAGSSLIDAYGIAMDAAGDLFITNSEFNAISEINITGIISTVAGNGNTDFASAPFAGDCGIPTAAQLDLPSSVSVDASGDIYIGDGAGPYKIREVFSANKPSFTAGHTQHITVCENTSIDISSLLSVNDLDNGRPLIWDTYLAAAHSRGSIFYTSSSDGGTVVPFGLLYTPTPGYSGLDSFSVVVNYCIAADTTKFYVTVNPMGAITGQMGICLSAPTTTLIDTTAGGTWTTSNPSVATIDPASGLITAFMAGSATISYSLPAGGCSAGAIVGVYPGLGAISQATPLYTGDYTIFTDASIGGSWSSSTTLVATIGSTTGIIYGVAPGTATVSYSLGSTCSVTYTATVLPSKNWVITSIAGNGTSGYSGDGGPAINAQLSTPVGTAVDQFGNVYIADCLDGVVRKVDSFGVITTFAGNGTMTDNGDGGPAVAAGIHWPWSIAVDNSGNVYIGSLYYIRKVNTSGVISTIAGNGTLDLNGDGAPATSAGVSPQSIAADIYGNIYLSNPTCIRKINPAGIISLFAGNEAITGYSGDGGPATAALLSNVTGLATDAAGNVYVCDGTNRNVREINTSGIITTIAGNGTAGFSGDGGPATMAELSFPDGVVVDNANNIYISDGFRIRKINPAGIISTFAGTGTSGFSGDCGAPIDAMYAPNGPSTIGIDIFGNLYIPDRDNFRVRKINSVQHHPHFVAGHNYNLRLCEGSGFNIDTILAVQDSDYGLTLNWSILDSSTQGAVTVAYVCQSDGGVEMPFRENYVPRYGYSGLDSFKIVVGFCEYTDTISVHVLTLPIGPVIGPTCIQTVATMTDTTPSGLWSSSDPSVAEVGSLTGFVTAVSQGSTLITYTSDSGCMAYLPVNVYPSFPTPLGTPKVCVGLITMLHDAVSGGFWSDPLYSSRATVDPLSGIVTGISPGTVMITYTVGESCVTTQEVTVNPTPPAITGNPYACPGTTTLLGNSLPGGQWTSFYPFFATVGATTGIVTGVSSGVSTGVTPITYMITATGCFADITVTINPLPLAITGVKSFCQGTTTHLSDATSGGAWQTGNAGIATVGGATGIVNGVSAGTTTISYVLPTGCLEYTTVTVNPLPAAITGNTGLCMGTPNHLADITPGGTWSTADDGVARVGSLSGIVSTVTLGTTNIIYTLEATGCTTETSVTVNPLPGLVIGNNQMCQGNIDTFQDFTPEGFWSTGSSNVTVGSGNGAVAGITSGPATITYELPTGCYNTGNITINPLPSPISGNTGICLGFPTTLSDGTSGGTWSSSDTDAAKISSTGTVTSVSVGTSIITYMAGSGCYATTTVNVVAALGAITGSVGVCPGASIPLSDATPGGIWSSTDVAVMSVGSTTGILTGNTAGTAEVTYSFGGSCRVYHLENVLPIPAAITGTTALCPGATATLNDATAGGTWQSGDPAIASIATGGVVTASTAGTAVITYTSPWGCINTRPETINQIPDPIMGTLSVCQGSATTLTDSYGSGTWTSDMTSVARVGATTGIVTGIAYGTAIITFTVPTGCNTTTTVTVTGAPTSITGVSGLCVGNTTVWTDGVSGGSWVSSLPGTASVDPSSGTVTGVTAGTSMITYSLGTGCITFKTITVSPNPTEISGVLSVCFGAHTDLSDGLTGGTWRSSYTGIAVVGATTGIVTGVGSGTSIISYTMPSGCMTATTVSVSDTHPTISGPSTVCIGATIPLTTTGVGSWSSSASSIASVDASSGVVSGVATGTATITFAATAGCTATAAISVNGTTTSIIGPTSVCTGANITLNDPTGGGTWASSDASTASIGAHSGVVSAIAGGTVTITYTSPAGCLATQAVTVNPTAPPITGAAPFCAGSALQLADGGGSGTWASADVSTANVDPVSGLVSGVAAGTTIISFTPAAGCGTATTITVTTQPGPIAGTTGVCAGISSLLSNTVSGGAWSTTAPAIASITGAGLFTGVSEGTATITYMIGGCVAQVTVTVSPQPGAISGTTFVCAGSTSTLSDATTLGAWSDPGYTTVAIVNAGTGVVTGLSAGTAIITYSTGVGCIASITFTVNVNPLPITGVNILCPGDTTVLADATPGGAWNSADNTIASFTSPGHLHGFRPGTDIVRYTIGSCYVTIPVIVNDPPAPITGPDSMCADGGAITEADASAPLGTWGYSFVTGDASGNVTGAIAGVGTITYSLSSGCYVTRQVTVLPLPDAITGPASVCPGGFANYTDTTLGGTWGAPAYATYVTVNTTIGLVNGLIDGSAILTYTLPTGCAISKTIQIIPIPLPAITGDTVVCATATATLADSATGGSWATGADTVAAISTSSGIVTGIAAGTAVITYTLTNSCGTLLATTTISVNPLPVVAPITGDTALCIGAQITLTDTSIGTWSSGNAGASLQGDTVTGVHAGPDTIYYSVTNSCGAIRAAWPIIVDSLPIVAAINGPSSVCKGSEITLSDATLPGTWSSSNASATVSSGAVTGIAAGSATISYSVTNNCGVSVGKHVIAIDPLPYAGAVAGDTALCNGEIVTYNDAAPGGIWGSVDTTIASINDSGTLNALLPGHDTIYYTVTNSCGTARADFGIHIIEIPAKVAITTYPVPSTCTNTEFMNFGTATPAPSGTEYMWSAINAAVYAVSANEQSCLINFNQGGQSVVVLSVGIPGTKCFSSDSMDYTTGFNTAPHPQVVYYYPELVCSDNTADSYQWGYDNVQTLDSTAIPGAVDENYYDPNLDVANNYYWVMTFHNGCIQKSYYNAPLQVSTPASNGAKIILYPNPARELLNITIEGGNKPDGIEVKLFDVLGQNVKTTVITGASGSIALTGLASGVYMAVILENGEAIGSQSFIKQ